MRPLNILVGCEESGTLRDILRDMGHEAWSNDLEDVEPRGHWSNYHLYGDVRDFLTKTSCCGEPWDIAFFFTPCTFLCNSGVKHLYKDGSKRNGKDLKRWRNMRAGAELFKICLEADIPRVVCENPIMHGYAKELVGRGPDQIVQPWQFGHRQMKATCFWRTAGMPDLVSTYVVGPPPLDPEKRKAWAIVHRMSPGPDRAKYRSQTYYGIARALAEQYVGCRLGHLIPDRIGWPQRKEHV